LRGRTYFEKNHPFCLTGIYSEDLSLLEEKEFGIIHRFIAWKDGFPSGFASGVPEGSLLMISWEPYIEDFEEESILPLIAGGKYDELIKRTAAEVREYSKPVLIRWGHEMNGDWYPWAGVNNENSPDNYISSFRRIVNIFQETDALNARFIFSVNYEDVPGKSFNRFENYYPGSEYADFLGLSVYNWGDTLKWGEGFRERSRWRSPRRIISPAYERLIRMDPDKAILITETGSTSSGGDKKKWMRSFFRLLKRRFRGVKAFVWFDIAKETDWGYTDDEELLEIYRSETADDFFRTSYLETGLFNE